MDTILLLCFFLLGLIFGSFFHVVGSRVPQQQPFTNDRSACPNCQRTLSWYELIPVLSYMLQRGQCRHCKKPITFTYPAAELATGVLFTLSYAEVGFRPELITAILLMAMLVILFISDMSFMLIPNSILLFFLPLFIIMRIIQPLDPWWASITGAFVGLAIIALIILVSNGGMGAGDMKLFGVLGIVLGVEKTLLTFFLSCMIGAIIGAVLLLFKIIDHKQPVPFGPYIVLATIVTYFYGESLINWYVNL
ncbi:prepilin peptidase [Lentibacillus cibarius]|uniref:Prepilin peptidase n=1 Tax=Lentibacillus cibarius TaxID=2583219 RepID=A0A549YM57_9BACI|nr:A24 family peptidase [Lentibacillus cibarius]TRM12947.1 prepilin peptidase [Lentibacillus cibarius]